jgi:L-seryl-tRNA(Ser) seleniumtransferase
VSTLARHPLARALRVDKLTAAALEATLAGPAAPVAQQLAADPDGIADRARLIAAALAGLGVEAAVEATAAAVGGGGAPGVTLPSTAVSLPVALAERLRAGSAVRDGRLPAVVGRIDGGRLLLDLRAVSPADDQLLISAVTAAAG